ncbi:hypothetical protein TNCV_644711 [Trichonephila clavipes]|nr:hypothetical protein TNCV_644711 [Trichonephila clavipes]
MDGMESQGILSILFSYIRAFGNGPHNFEPWSVNSNSTPASSNILDCKKTATSLSEYSEQIVLQWIPGNCGVTGTEFADHLAKKGASIQQKRKAIPFTSAKRIIKKKVE